MIEGLNTWKYDQQNWKPFKSGYFNTIDQLLPVENGDALKQWLHDRLISFEQNVFLVPNYTKHCIYTTWRIIVEYSPTLFFNDDIVIFDKTSAWCLYYFHEGHLYFGSDKA